ncbi:MAG: hypothetical protein M1541_03605 [Acidobacteria bacterium]|nr:hypothetical protein [Acidobacteriota bacterium]
MPWEPKDAEKHTHLADTPARRRQWAHVANGVLKRTGDEARAIQSADSVLKTHPSMKDSKMKNNLKEPPAPKQGGSGVAPGSAQPPAGKTQTGKKHGDGKSHWTGH